MFTKEKTSADIRNYRKEYLDKSTEDYMRSCCMSREEASRRALADWKRYQEPLMERARGLSQEM